MDKRGVEMWKWKCGDPRPGPVGWPGGVPLARSIARRSQSREKEVPPPEGAAPLQRLGEGVQVEFKFNLPTLR